MIAIVDDIKPYGDAIIYASLLSGSGFAVWKMWFKPIVQWVREQGDTNATVAKVVTEELPKMTKAIERVSDTQRDHSKKIADLDHRVAHIETSAVAGGMPAYEPDPPMSARRRRTAE